MISAPSRIDVLLALANPDDVSCGITYCANEPMYWIEEDVRSMMAEILSGVTDRELCSLLEDAGENL